LKFPGFDVSLEQDVSGGNTHIFRRGWKTWKWEEWSKYKGGTIVMFLVGL
jgi:hypothetical protein